MLTSDSVAAVCSLAVLLLWNLGSLQIIHIYMVNAVIGFMNAFQQPASAVAVGRLVPKEEMGRISGLNSFSSNLITVFSPIIAATVFAFGGIKIVLTIDFATFLFAFSILLFVIKIPEVYENRKKEAVFAGCKDGFAFLFQNKGLWYIVVTMAVINFLSRLTYENILSPMILFRSGNNTIAYGIVNAAIGVGGIAGGLLVSIGKLPKDRVKTMYGAAAISFLLGDLTMGLGRNFYFWSFAGIAASLPIPFIMAAQNVILYEKIPTTIQGRVFAVRNAVQFGTIPVAILLGGFLAEYVFEPFVQSENVIAKAVQMLVGTGNGSGMAAMFLCTGIIGSLFSFAISRRKEMNDLRYAEEDKKMENRIALVYREMKLEEAEMISQIDATWHIKNAWRWNASTGEYELQEMNWTEYELPNGFDWHLNRFKETIRLGGKAFGCFESDRLVGYVTLNAKLFGIHEKYVLLDQLFISEVYRNQGIGKELVSMCKSQAALFGAEKIYLCSASAEDTIAFYKKLGCIAATERNEELFAEDPNDIQLELAV